MIYRTGKLNRDVTLVPFDGVTVIKSEPVTFPEGTAVIQIGRGLGLSPLWAISSESLVAEVTGNAHDSKYHYIWIDPADVTEND